MDDCESDQPPSAEEIDALLPQTQCTRCGYQGCLPYAHAIATRQAEINRCPPGGTATIRSLAKLLGRAPLPLDTRRGAEGPPLVAVIDEEICIGCARCLPPCPVDAIVGARQQMHTVIAELCTGCELCVAPCPVDCIQLLARPAAEATPSAELNRARYRSHVARLGRRESDRAEIIAARKAGHGATPV